MTKLEQFTSITLRWGKMFVLLLVAREVYSPGWPDIKNEGHIERWKFLLRVLIIVKNGRSVIFYPCIKRVSTHEGRWMNRPKNFFFNNMSNLLFEYLFVLFKIFHKRGQLERHKNFATSLEAFNAWVKFCWSLIFFYNYKHP